MTLPLIRKIVAAVFYGDELMSLANQTRPYENEPARGCACGCLDAEGGEPVR
ncbi:MAG: hypothetical protein ACLR7U_08265 [Ruthenibacterium lactatiformans]